MDRPTQAIDNLCLFNLTPQEHIAVHEYIESLEDSLKELETANANSTSLVREVYTWTKYKTEWTEKAEKLLESS